MIDNFDANGLTLKTDQSAEQPQVGQEPGTGGMMAAAAKHATQLGK